MSDHIVLLTGERGVGKSTVCHKVVELAQAREHTCSGILTVRLPGDERDLLDVSSGARRRLTLAPDAEPAVSQGRFRFDPQTLAWGNERLAQAPPCHLLVVDELGPLELERGEGLLRAFDALRRGSFALALVVVRPELLVRAQLRMPTSASSVLHVTEDNRDGLPGEIIEVLKNEVRDR